MYRTFVSFTVSLTFIFMFTETFRSHFIFWPFPNVTLISHILISFVYSFLYAVCNDTLISTSHYLRSSSLSSSKTYPHNLDPTKRLLTFSYFSFLFSQQSTALCPLFPQLFHSPLKRGEGSCCPFCYHFLYLSFLINMTFCGHICHNYCIYPWTNFHGCFVCFSPGFNAITFSSGSVFSFFLISVQLCLTEPTNIFLEVLNSIFEVFTFQDTLVGLYSSG